MSKQVNINSLIAFLNEFSDRYIIDKYFYWPDKNMYVLVPKLKGRKDDRCYDGLLCYDELSATFKPFNPMDYEDEFPTNPRFISVYKLYA